jgi:hypothetical protein
LIPNAPQAVGLATPRVDLEAGARFGRQSTGAVMLRGKFHVPRVNLHVGIVRVFETHIGDLDFLVDDFESMPPGDCPFHCFRALALVFPGAGQIGVEIAFDLLVQLDADDFAATAFDFIADLVIKEPSIPYTSEALKKENVKENLGKARLSIRQFSPFNLSILNRMNFLAGFA